MPDNLLLINSPDILLINDSGDGLIISTVESAHRVDALFLNSSVYAIFNDK